MAVESGRVAHKDAARRGPRAQLVQGPRHSISLVDACRRHHGADHPGGVIASLIQGSIPAFKAFGFGFLTTQVWNPVTDEFGALAPRLRHCRDVLIAMLFAVPVGLGIAVFLTELCPEALRRPIGIAIELLAGIPVDHLRHLGTFRLRAVFAEYVQPGLISLFGNVPVLSSLFAGPPYGIGMLTAGFILAIMVLPFITSISRDVFNTVPAASERSRPTAAAARLGRWSASSSSPIRASALSAASCWRSAAHSAKPWP